MKTITFMLKWAEISEATGPYYGWDLQIFGLTPEEREGFIYSMDDVTKARQFWKADGTPATIGIALKEYKDKTVHPMKEVMKYLKLLSDKGWKVVGRTNVQENLLYFLQPADSVN